MTTKRTVAVHVTFLKLGEINTLKENFDADILLRMKWREPSLDDKKPEDFLTISWEKMWNPNVFIENAIGEPKMTVSRQAEIVEGEAFVTERKLMKGTFLEQLELWEFPFDVQDLTVSVMSDLPTTEVELADDPDEIHKIYRQSFIDEQEWYLYKYVEGECGQRTKDQADPTVKRSTLTAKCKAARRPEYFIWNIFSVTFLICALAFVTFAVSPTLPQNRLQLTFTLVLTAVAFKFVVNQSLPRISYLTYLDRYILATLVFIFLVCLWHGIQTLIPSANKKDYVAFVVFVASCCVYNIQFMLRIYLRDRYILATMVMVVLICFWHGLQTVIPGANENDFIACVVFISLYAIYTTQFILRIIFKPYKTRRQMRKKEAAYTKRVKQAVEEALVKEQALRAAGSKPKDATNNDAPPPAQPQNLRGKFKQYLQNKRAGNTSNQDAEKAEKVEPTQV